MQVLKRLVIGIEQLSRRVLVVCKWLTILIVAAMASCIFLGVFSRYVLNDPLVWYEEASKFLMVWMVFIAAPIAYRRGDFVSIDIIGAVPSPRLRALLHLAVNSMVLFLLYQLTFHGWGLALNAWGQQPMSIPVSFFWIYVVVPLGSAVMMLVTIEFWLRALNEAVDPAE